MARKKLQSNTQQHQHHEQTSMSVSASSKNHLQQRQQSFSSQRNWIRFPQVQSKLFYECTLFLYSILVLFLEYLNLYKTLWWLPKSHCHSTFKFYLINPYVLSCIGLLLGIRVTKCFWDAITKKFNQLNADGTSVFWSITEYALIKSPLVTMILSSFVFSFSRILQEYELISVVYLILPLIFYFCIFYSFLKEEWLISYKYYTRVKISFSIVIEDLMRFDIPAYPRLTHRKHNCQVDNRRDSLLEASVLWREINYRFRLCIYIGFYTAYFSVILPTVFVPKRTVSGLEQQYLTESHWLHLMSFTVFMTSAFLYSLYQFPLELIDRLYHCACHLGSWIEVTEAPEQFSEWKEDSDVPKKHNDVVVYFRAQRHPNYDQIDSSPINNIHRLIYKIGKDPVAWVRNACLTQAALIAFQFYTLVMATNWQHIFTLVMLMFSNCLLFGKFLKDYVIVSYVYGDDRRNADGTVFPFGNRPPIETETYFFNVIDKNN